MDWEALIIIALLIVFLVTFFFIRSRYMRRLNQEVDRAQKSEHLKTVFLANVSHALRTPLNAIIGFSDILIKEGNELPKDQLAEISTHINKNGHQLLYFISQLLELSNYEGSIPTFSLIEVNLAELIASYRRETLLETNPNVTIRIRTQLSPHCKGTLDTNLMYQLMMHLLRNAAQHTSKGSITIEYGRERNGLQVSVTDTGDGIPEKYRENLFSMLQNEDSLTLEGQAVGLGLSICKAITDALNGEINITSETGKGTTARIWFPCRMRDMDQKF